MKHQGKNKFSKPQNKKGRVIVRNIPYKATDETLRKHFASFGPIREINLLRRADGNPVGCGFVQFNNEDDAVRAIKRCSGKDFMGRNITVEMAMQQAHFIVSRPDTEDAVEDQVQDDSKPEMEDSITDFDVNDQNVSIETSSEVNSTFPAKRKRNRIKGNADKKGRIIVRNLSFKANEAALEKHFSQYGDLSEVTILRKPDGKMVGCGFIQFTDRKKAAQAIVECSGKPLLGRPIVLDWAVPKSLYTAKNESEVKAEIKEEPLDEDVIKIERDLDDMESVKSEPHSEIKMKRDNEDEESAESDVSLEDDKDVEEPVAKRPRVFSNDISEGRTVFVKNVPFAATNNDLRQCMERFGPIFYALICMDRFTEHSKGTAFVKFTNVESAVAALEAGTELTLHGQVLDCQKALNRDEVQSKSKNTTNKKDSKDNRNLYLVKEGVVLASTKSAEGVSVTDMAKRLQLEQWKSQMLRNLNMFVARDRLAVHNIPPSYDDEKLRDLFQKNAGPNAVIKEARVMRDMRNVDIKGIGKSKETGFVKFSTHEDALQALRKINNNPNIFTKAKRPIVAFSIENRAIHKVRKLREQKSLAKNPTFAKKDDEQAVNTSKKSFKKEKRNRKKLQKQAQSKPTNIEGEEYTGVAAVPGFTELRSNYKLKRQAALHTDAVRQDSRKKKSLKRSEQQQKIQREIIKQPKQKKGSKKNSTQEDQNFSKLVNKYVSKISAPVAKRKWYDT